MANIGNRFDCFNCGGNNSLCVTDGETTRCDYCGLITTLVEYDCEPRHCCPKGYVACPLCKQGKKKGDRFNFQFVSGILLYMPRTARIILPNSPHHVIQRGHNHQVVFAADADYQYYLNNLWEWKAQLGCRVYAYCLMTNHVHLVVDPGRRPAHLSLLMKRVAGRQTRYVNALEHRSGTLWEGRFKSSPIQRDAYLLACCRYVELNPVRAGLVATPRDYPWSSYRSRAGWASQGALDLDEGYLSLGTTPAERVKQYRAWVRGGIPEGEWELIREAIQRGQLTGGDRFVDEVARKLGRRVERRGPGRPVRQAIK